MELLVVQRLDHLLRSKRRKQPGENRKNDPDYDSQRTSQPRPIHAMLGIIETETVKVAD